MKKPKIISYRKSTDKSVVLDEYFFLEEDSEHQRFAILKLINKEDKAIVCLTIELIEQNINHIPLFKRQYQLTDLREKPNQRFVPLKKFLVDSETEYLEFNLMYVVYKENDHQEEVNEDIDQEKPTEIMVINTQARTKDIIFTLAIFLLALLIVIFQMI